MLQGIIEDIVREHVEQAGFQWSQHRMLSQAIPPDMAAITSVQARLAANLDAVLIAGEAAWPIILDRFEDYPEPGELFVIGHLAVATNATKRINHALKLVHQTPAARSGLAGALTWFPPQTSGPIVQQMLDAQSPIVRAVAVDVLAHHRANPQERLVDWLADPSPVLRASACYLAAAANRGDCAETVAALANADDPELRFAAVSALATFGHPKALASLKAEIETGPRGLEALRLLSRVLPPADFLSYLGALFQPEETRPLAVRGIGMTGDRRRLGWLIEQMGSPATALPAGESFLELFPEAAGVAELFSDDLSVLGPQMTTIVEAGTDFCPVRVAIQAWAIENKFHET